MPGIENLNWLVGIRVYRTSQVVCPSTVIYLTKLHKKLLAILLYAYGAIERQQGSKVLVWLQVEAVEVGWLQAEAVEIGWLQAGAVEVGWLQAEQ